MGLDKIHASLTKKYNLNPIVSDETVERVSSGSIMLDLALGGGWPRGRVSEIFGQEHSGKTLLGILAAVTAQQSGFNVAVIDTEHSFELGWAGNFGLQRDKLTFFQPHIGEDACNMAIDIIRSGEYGLLLYDSIGGTSFAAALQSPIGKTHVGIDARMWSAFIGQAVPAAAQTKTTVVMTNQIRMNIGVMYGNPETTPGGRRLRHAEVIRLKMTRQAKQLGTDTELTALSLACRTVKNKTAPPWRSAEISIRMKPFFGVDIAEELVNAGKDTGVFTREDGSPIKGNGAWYFRGEKIGGSRAATLELLENDDSIYALVLSDVQNAVNAAPSSYHHENEKEGYEENETSF